MTTTLMVPTMDETQIRQLLVAARVILADVPYCWVATRAEAGGTHARAVRMFASPHGRDEWTRRFLCRRGSRKIADFHRDPLVTLAYQDATGDRYLALEGRVSLIDDRAEMRELWSPAMDAVYPPGFAEANMMVARIEVDRMELHARGVTREPFGHGRTLIERIADDAWRFVPDLESASF